MKWTAASSVLLDFLLPRACVSCDSLTPAGEPGLVCGLCWSRLAVLPQPRCPRCGHPRRAAECDWCKLLPPFVRACRSWCWYPGGSAERIVAALKYGGWRNVADDIAGRLARLTWPDDVMAERPLVVPVPLNALRERERGYNQSALIAQSIALRWNLPVAIDSLVRSRVTASQTRLTPEERARNVAGAFTIRHAPASTLRGAHVLLIDDVVTTAATLNECATALFTSGARTISYLTFGRARASGDTA